MNRAPGSSPESPSSSLVVPEDAAKQEPTAEDVAREQDRAKFLAEEEERRAANPLNLSKEDQEKREDAAKPMADTGSAGSNEPPASPAF